MKTLLTTVFTFLYVLIIGQIDTGRYESSCAILELKENGHFKYTDGWNQCYATRRYSGQYSIKADTLILQDTANTEFNIVRIALFVIKETKLIFARDTFFNTDNKAYKKSVEKFKKEHHILKSSTVRPGYFKKCGDLIRNK